MVSKMEILSNFILKTISRQLYLYEKKVEFNSKCEQFKS